MKDERKSRIEDVLAKRQNSITVVLENVFDPHNVSAVMRSCDAIGIQELYIVNTEIPRPQKWGFRSSASASKWLTIYQFERVDECYAAIKLKYDKLLTTHLSSDARDLYDLDLTGKLALVFGNEHAGISKEMLALSDGNFSIPQAGMIKSLNISVACAVALYEAFRQKTIAGHYQQACLSQTDQSLLRRQWGVYDEK